VRMRAARAARAVGAVGAVSGAVRAVSEFAAGRHWATAYSACPAAHPRPVPSAVPSLATSRW
jgi:hypothetical protein